MSSSRKSLLKWCNIQHGTTKINRFWSNAIHRQYRKIRNCWLKKRVQNLKFAINLCKAQPSRRYEIFTSRLRENYHFQTNMPLHQIHGATPTVHWHPVRAIWAFSCYSLECDESINQSINPQRIRISDTGDNEEWHALRGRTNGRPNKHGNRRFLITL